MLRRSIESLTTKLASEYLLAEAKNNIETLKVEMAQMIESYQSKENNFNQDLELMHNDWEKEKILLREEAENRMKLLQAQTATVRKQLRLNQRQSAEKLEKLEGSLRNEKAVYLEKLEEERKIHDSELQRRILQVQGQRDQEACVKEQMKAKWEEQEKLIKKYIKDLEMKRMGDILAEKQRQADREREIEKQIKERQNNKISTMTKNHQELEKKQKDQEQELKQKRKVERHKEAKTVELMRKKLVKRWSQIKQLVGHKPEKGVEEGTEAICLIQK